MGLVCDFSGEIKKVYTAVFPSPKVMQRILDDGAREAVLFVHHPSIWDIRKAPDVFQQMDIPRLKLFKDRTIAIYNLHVPLDNYGEYSTSKTLAIALGITPEKPFAPYFGALAGLIGHPNHTTVQDIRNSFQTAVGHRVSCYQYGDNKIKNGKIAVVAGGGNSEEILKEVTAAGANTLITGITANNNHSKTAHEFAQLHRINILGGTHYSTEKFACIGMAEYFKKQGLLSEFIADQPVMEDI